MIVVGVLLMVVAGAIGVNAAYTNRGSEHQVADGFTVFGYALEGSTGRVFLYGVIIGAVLLVGLYLTVIGSRREVRRRTAAKRELRRALEEKQELERERNRLAEKLGPDRESGGIHDEPSGEQSHG